MAIFSKLKKHKTVLSFSGTSFLLNITQMLVNLIIIRWISPAELGIWNTIIVLKNYSIILNLGTSNGLNRELPFFLGKNKLNIARLIAQTALFISICASIVSFFVIGGFAVFNHTDGLKMTSYLALALVISVTFLNVYLGTTFRTNQAFLKLSKVNLMLVFIQLISLILPSKYGYQGFLIRVVLVEIIRLIFLLVYWPFRVKPAFSVKGFRILFNTGILLFINTYLSSISETFKRVILKAFTSFHVVGLFSPALAIHAVNKMLPKSLGQFLFPKMNYQIGKDIAPKKIWKSMIKFILVNQVIMLPVIAIGWFLLPGFIRIVFPDYIEGIYPAQLALLSGLFVPFHIVNNIFRSYKSWTILFSLSAIRLAIYFGFQYWLVHVYTPIIGISYAIIISDLIYSVIIIISGILFIKSKQK